MWESKRKTVRLTTAARPSGPGVAYYLKPPVAGVGVKSQGDTVVSNNSPTAPVKMRHHHISVMELDHGLTYPEVSSKVCHDSFCQLGNSVSLPWVICYEAFYFHVVSSFSCIPPKHAGAEAKGSNPTTGLTPPWVRNPLRGNFNHCQVSQKEVKIRCVLKILPQAQS